LKRDQRSSDVIDAKNTVLDLAYKIEPPIEHHRHMHLHFIFLKFSKLHEPCNFRKGPSNWRLIPILKIRVLVSRESKIARRHIG